MDSFPLSVSPFQCLSDFLFTMAAAMAGAAIPAAGASALAALPIADAPGHDCRENDHDDQCDYNGRCIHKTVPFYYRAPPLAASTAVMVSRLSSYLFLRNSIYTKKAKSRTAANVPMPNPPPVNSLPNW